VNRQFHAPRPNALWLSNQHFDLPQLGDDFLGFVMLVCHY